MTSNTAAKRNPDDFITVTVLRSVHAEIKKYLEELNEGGDIGKFYDAAGVEKLNRLKDRNSLFSKFNTQTLISNKWKKIGNSKYQRGEDVVEYTGTFWLHNGERLTEDNYIDKIYDKMLAKVNPKLPPRDEEYKKSNHK